MKSLKKLISIEIIVLSLSACNGNPYEMAKEGNLLNLRYYLLFHPDAIIKNDDNGMNLIHYAVLGNKKNTCEYLIDKGAPFWIKDGNGNTPLHLASQKGYTEICKVLLSKGADPNIRNNNLDTPLFFVAENGDTEITKLLLSKGAQVNAMNLDLSWEAVKRILKEKNISENQFVFREFQDLILEMDLDRYNDLTSLQLQAKRNEFENYFQREYRGRYFLWLLRRICGRMRASEVDPCNATLPS